MQPVVVPVTWKDNEPLDPKLSRVAELIDRFSGEGARVDLVGCSASGPLMLLAFMARKDAVSRVVNVGGFLRPGSRQGFRSFSKRSAKSPAFREAVLRCAELEPSLTAVDRAKILTVRPVFDELVPPETVTVPQATNLTVPMPEHVLGIGLTLIKYDPVIRFLQG